MKIQDKKVSRVLKLVKKIPRGKVTTYNEIAKKLRMHPRAVAKALSKNPCPIKIPCHRIVHADGKIGGYKFGVRKKINLLKREGIKISRDKIIDFKNIIKLY